MGSGARAVDDRGRLAAAPGARRQAAAWLGLGIAALALAGVFAILLVVARAPGTSSLFPTQDFFRVALIVHVDQSVLIWFLAFAGVLWALAGGGSTALGRAAFASAAAGCLLVAVAPFLVDGEPLLSNYVPVLDHSLFLGALALFGLGVLLQVLGYLAGAPRSVRLDDPLAVGALTVAIAALAAAVSLAWTWAELSPAWERKAYFEYLFWGPGHVLQFAYTQLMLVAWIWLAQAIGRPLPLAPRWLSALLILGVLPLLTVPLIQGLHAPDSPEARLAFTRLMQFGNAVAAVPLGVLLALALTHHGAVPTAPEQRPVARALVASLVLFGAGGLLGASIAGVNTVIPAHYHGSIVGVTLAIMGLTYHLLPQLGLGRAGGRMARWQPVVYAVGQLLHIGGLAVSGAMGIERKTAGAAQGLEGWATQAAMGVMGLGGLLAVIGGILFVVVVLRAFGRRHRPAVAG
jgi:hypothetical protein